MEKNKKLIKKEGEASDKELENVSGGTEITGSESIKINNNNFDTSIKFNNVDTSIKINNNNFDTSINFNNFDVSIKINNNNVDMGIKHSNNFNNILLNNNSDIKILKNN